MESVFDVYNGRYIERGYSRNGELKAGVERFGSYEEAAKKVDDCLEEMDHSADETYSEPSGEGKFRMAGYHSKRYSYNVLAQKHGLQGFTINLAVVVWNKETGEIEYRMIEDEKLDALISLMPATWFMREIVELYKSRFEECRREGVAKLRDMINRHSTGYPLTYNFVHDLAKLHTGYNEKRGIEHVADSIYNSYIGCHFENG